MDTTAAAELGMGYVEGIDEAENWNAEGWEEQEYESQPPVRAPKYARVTRKGEENGPGLSSSNYGKTESNQSRSLPSAPEPPQKRIRTAHGRQGTDHGHFQENGGHAEETDSQVLDYNTAHNYDAGEWYGPESGGELGYPGGADGMWYPGYAPGVGIQHQFIDPSMIPNFYHGGMAADYGSAGPMNFFGMSAPPLGSGLENGRGRSSHIFYKTKLCSRFRAGTCTFDGSCNFAHGTAELRNPPPGWDGMVEQDHNGWGRGQRAPSASNQSSTRNQRGPSDYPRFQQTRPCKNYFTKGVCPYGDKCIFLHDIDGLQSKANRDGSTWSGRYPGGGRRGGRGGRGSFSWKTKMCRRWETTGECNYGENCHYAHGTADLQKYGGGGADSFSSGAYTTLHKESFGVSGPNSSTEAPYDSSEGPKASVDPKVPLDGYSDINEDWDDDREWETPNPVAVDWQENQSFKNDYAENNLYPAESHSVRYFHQQPQQNVPYYYATNKHNASRQSSSGKDIVVRGAAKNLTAEEHDYYTGYEEGFDA